MTKTDVLNYLEEIKNEVSMLSLEIWNHPELSEEEEKAADLYRKALRDHGFTISEVSEELHAFMAEYGQGSPVIAVLGEYDALPGLSQKVDTKPNPVVQNGPGHGCGHNLLGAAAFGAALAITKYLETTGKQGTVRFYGCPEEESLVGKVKMIRAGAFDGCDLALSWHPMNVNCALETAYLANSSIKFRFEGISAHAALMTETTVEPQVLGGCYELLPNKVLFDLTYQNMTEIEPPTYTEEELKFAKALQESLDPDLVQGEIKKFVSTADEQGAHIFSGILEKEQSNSVTIAGSSDSGDVSWIMPMNLFLTATWPLGVPAHSWQATSASGSTLGLKGMHYAAQIFAGIMYDLLNDRQLVEEAKTEFADRTKDRKYVSPLP